MQEEKQIIIDDLLAKINDSPFVLVADYSGMTVPEFAELRTRLKAAGTKFHVAKNTFVKRAVDAAELPAELSEHLTGQSAIVTGEEDVCGAAKILKGFKKEFERPNVRGGVLDGDLLDEAQIQVLADLPSKEALQAQFLGLISKPAQQLVTVLNEPGSALARLFQAKSDKGE